MNQTSPEVLLESLRWRYAVKRFDPDKKIPSDTWSAIEQSLVLTPSSYGLQPWQFIVIQDSAIKQQLPAISWNQKQPQDCSHMVVLAARRSMDEAYITNYMQSVVDMRQLPSGAMDGYQKMLVSTVGKINNHLDWNARQVYIALGQLMLAAAMLGVDACPMEGINPADYDQLLGLIDTDYTSVVGCALGYRHAEDAQALAAKVRFPAQMMVKHF